MPINNSICLFDSRKQYSPLNPSSSEETETPPERIEIDLMHELRDVIFPNIPPVNRNVSKIINKKFNLLELKIQFKKICLNF